MHACWFVCRVWENKAGEGVMNGSAWQDHYPVSGVRRLVRLQVLTCPPRAGVQALATPQVRSRRWPIDWPVERRELLGHIRRVGKRCENSDFTEFNWVATPSANCVGNPGWHRTRKPVAWKVSCCTQPNYCPDLNMSKYFWNSWLS